MSETTEPAAPASSGSEEQALERRLAGLSPDKRALLEKRLLARREVADEPPTITPRTTTGPAPLSFVQELMWLVHEMSPGTHAYNSSGARRLRGPLDTDALQAAIDGVVHRHSALRTTFDVRDGEPVQIINDDARVMIERIERPGLDGQQLTDLLRELVRRPFDLRMPPLMRATLVALGPEDHVLLTSANHIVWDGWSKGIYFGELAEIYDARCTGREPVLAELPIQYVDFAVWQRAWLSGERMQRQLDYWRERLTGAPPLLELPTDRSRPTVQTHNGDRMELWVEAETLAGLRALAKANNVTPFMVLTAAWVTFLHRFSGQSDIVVGTPIAGRNRGEVEGLIGYFNNTLALRVDCSGDPTFPELLTRVREIALGAYANQDVSFEHVVRAVAPQRDPSYSPVFQSLIVLQNAASESLRLRGLTMDMIVTESGTAKFDLSLGMGEYQGRLHASIEYNSDLFDRETVARVRTQFATLLDGLVADGGSRLSALPLLGAEDRSAIAELGRGPVVAIPDQTLYTRFAEQARATPDQPAVRWRGDVLTYSDLAARSAAVAGALRARGLGRGDYVGMCFERSADFVVAVLGILAAGAACVPLDPEYPSDRLAAMIADAGVKLCVTGPELCERVAALGTVAATLADLRAAEPADGIDADAGDAAYVIFTSGSTGRPHGVVLEHRGLLNEALAMIAAYDLGPADRVLQFASVSFDISLEELFGALLSGATLVLREPDVPLAGDGFLEWLDREGISVMDLPTAFWHEWTRDLADLERSPHEALRLLIVGGEKASAEAFDAWRRLAPAVRWVNTYGPTEASIVATAFEAPMSWERRPGAELPIGSPLPNVGVHVLDAHDGLVGPGVRGELHITGVGLAREYLGLPAATAERFVALPWSGERAYRTGDVVRRGADGTLDFIGRTDDQIKLRGFRIEPKEVEAALKEDADVTGALVCLRDLGSGPALAAYIVVEPAVAEAATSRLRRDLGDRLPAFSVPGAIVCLSAFPLTVNGKVDRDALPAPEPQATAEHVEPADAVERELAAIWSELLGHPVGALDSFFEIGGHSMLAVRMFGLVERRLGVRLPLATLLRAATVRALAEVVRRGGDDGWAFRALVPIQPDGSGVPLFLIHSLTGDVLIYRHLVRHIDPDRPVYGLEAPGFDGREAPLSGIPEMAALYIAELKAIQPQGPYLLAGLCYGGAVAHEMAHQLESAGEPVAFVGLIDANPLGLVPRVRFAQRVRRHLVEWRELPWAERFHFLVSTGRNAIERVQRVVRRQVIRRVYIDRGRPLPSSLVDMMSLNKAAAVDYRTPDYGGQVTLLRVHDPGRPPREDIRMRWTEFASGGVDVRDVVSPGAGHITVLREPHVRPLAAELEHAITDALNGATP